MGTELDLVGRGDELRRLSRVLTDGGLGLPRAAVLVGEPGIGKTRLLEEFAARAGERGFHVVVARGRPGTSAVPAGAFLDVLPAAPPAGDEASVLWWVRNTLVGMGERLVVVVDDAHLADELSLAVCHHLADSGRVAVVVAARSTEPAPEGLSHLVETAGVDMVRLDPLDLEATASLVGQIEGAEVEEEGLREVYRLTDGVPLVVRELVRAAADAKSRVSQGPWRWDRAIARDPNLGSLLAGRLGHVESDTRSVLWLLVAADGPVPETAATLAVSATAVDDAVQRGLLTRSEGWLEWSHALLGELAVDSLTGSRTTSSRLELLSALRAAGLADPDILQLAADLDLESSDRDYELQLAAARATSERGLHAVAATHAEAAMEREPQSHEACLLAGLAAVSLGRSDAADLVGRALDTAGTDDQLLDATTACVHRIFGTSGDAGRASNVVSQAKSRTQDHQLERRLDYLTLVIAIVASSPEDFLAAALDYRSSDELHPVDKAAVEGTLSIMLAIVGEVEEAAGLAASSRESLSDDMSGYDQTGGFYGGALAAFFAGDAHEATRLLVAGSDTLSGTPGSEEEVSARSMQFAGDVFRGHCDTSMSAFAGEADAIGSLRFGVLWRAYAVWDLALRRDRDAERLWEELQQAPAPLRQGPAFLEALAGVALVASKGQTADAAEMALGIAELMAPARSAAAWLLHDAARHGRAADVVDRLDEIAATQPRRYLPAIFADSARAMASDDPDQLTAVAAEFRAGGFDLFAAELDALAAARFRGRGEGTEAARCVVDARADVDRAGGSWTPLLDILEDHPLTDRQREICRLVVQGKTNAQIAEMLFISKRTVENQLHRAYAELGVSRAELGNIPL